ncbi:hypothetical protein COCMIDRAFT_98278 [Bipolaris oryzae ATCC 44560]|uniref:Uncharacterized protein n=1 Tax=Bipolaris oryzae ATCC 44560 TaxID=930090 RepID=W6ZLD6_COCMI|nr:uncharacterized protein COCMIDRAFT_98278 [Bipolaris oryzae ATCC 44560]EUC44396.1 hypothetical protein COCMIDRAFT_98278 [Bipolaris oryzae ATCC 44560]
MTASLGALSHAGSFGLHTRLPLSYSRLIGDMWLNRSCHDSAGSPCSMHIKSNSSRAEIAVWLCCRVGT